MVRVLEPACALLSVQSHARPATCITSVQLLGFVLTTTTTTTTTTLCRSVYAAESPPLLLVATTLYAGTRFGGFGSDYCSGNTAEMWRDRSEFVKLAGQRAAQHFPGGSASSTLLIESTAADYKETKVHAGLIPAAAIASSTAPIYCKGERTCAERPSRPYCRQTGCADRHKWP